MNILRNLLTSLNKSLKKIKLIDKCLIIFMIILMTQSIYNLFFNETSSQYSNGIDVVIRTTSASIFGYFLSANFINRYKNKHPSLSEKIEVLNEKQLSSNSDNEIDQDISNQQIIIATIIGVISLIVIIVFRNSADVSSASLATISQLRDFVSGCVGFLLGCPTKKVK